MFLSSFLLKPSDRSHRRTVTMFQFQRKTAEGKELFAAEPQILEILDVHNILLAEQLLMPRQCDIRNRVEADYIKTDALIRQAFATEIPDTTIIIIAQRLSSVENADNIIMMDNGHIAAQGNHNELLRTSDEYRSIYESQNNSGVISDGE